MGRACPAPTPHPGRGEVESVDGSGDVRKKIVGPDDAEPREAVRAIDYVTGGYVPGAPVIAPEPEAEEEEIGVAVHGWRSAGNHLVEAGGL